MLRKLNKELGRIENLSCDFKYRGKGVASKLLDNVIEFSKEIGLKKICLGTYEHLQSAIAFYEKHGFVEQKERRDKIKCSRYYELTLN